MSDCGVATDYLNRGPAMLARNRSNLARKACIEASEAGGSLTEFLLAPHDFREARRTGVRWTARHGEPVNAWVHGPAPDIRCS